MLENPQRSQRNRRLRRVGMVGGGQLARMTAAAAARLDVPFTVLDPDPHCPASAGAHVVVGDPLDASTLLDFANGVDVVTFDHERVPIELVRELEARGVVVAPGAATAQMAFDKAVARVGLAELGFAVPEFAIVSDAAGIDAFASRHGWPVVAKSARGGYDGRGVMFVRPGESAEAVSTLGAELVVEQMVPFDGEIAVLVARRATGEIVPYPPVSTVQRDGMCAEVTCPAAVAPHVARAAEELAIRLADAVGLVGVMAVEMFVVGEQLLVNELATRPHNTGHHTIEACVTSQFEQHLRAVLDLPLGSTALRAPAAAMYNVIGSPEADDPTDRLAEALEIDGAHVHLYGKQSRPGRKLGHVTALAATVDEARSIAALAAERLNRSARELSACSVGERA